jgi:hypothetical protein
MAGGNDKFYAVIALLAFFALLAFLHYRSTSATTATLQTQPVFAVKKNAEGRIVDIQPAG